MMANGVVKFGGQPFVTFTFQRITWRPFEQLKIENEVLSKSTDAVYESELSDESEAVVVVFASSSWSFPQQRHGVIARCLSQMPGRRETKTETIEKGTL